MKLLHSADLHLGSPLRAAAGRDPVQGARLRAAADGVLDRIVDLALAERVDALVLAGDVFDNDVQDVTLRARLAAALGHAAKGGVPSVLIRGNHDALMDYERFGPLGDGIHLLDRTRPSVEIGDAIFHGLGFEARHADASMLPDYPSPVPGRINVGVMHTSLDGAAGHDPYAPCAAADLLAHGYDYWALGHIHIRSEIVADGVALVMPGIPQGRHAGEPGQGTATLATLGGAPELRAAPVADVIFDRAEVALAGLDQAAMIAAFRDAVPDGEAYRLMRFAVSGSDLPETTLAAFAAEALEGAEASVEAVRRLAAPAAMPSGLLSLAAEEAASDSYRDAMRAVLAEMREAGSRERAIREVLDAVLADDALDTLIAEGLVEARLALGGEG